VPVRIPTQYTIWHKHIDNCVEVILMSYVCSKFETFIPKTLRLCVQPEPLNSKESSLQAHHREAIFQTGQFIIKPVYVNSIIFTF